MHAPDGDGRIFGARNRTHVCSAGGAAACTPIPISLTSTHIPIYMYSAHTYIDSYIYTYTYIHTYIHTNIHTYNPSFVSAAVPTHVHTRACTHPHVCACIGGPAAHTGPRRTDDPPIASRLRWPRRPGRRGGAYISQRGDRSDVPRADVRVERTRLAESLRAEPPAVDAGGGRSHVTA
jgi:hypothetical protein